jgi:long-chain acyl-CoA synthetase
LVLIAQGLEDGAAIDSLRCVVSSSAGMDSSTKKSLLETLHCDFHECYGTSEIAVASNLDPATARIRTETVGRAVESVDIQILDDHDRTLPPGQVGEIVCQTPMLFGGYYKKPKETAEAMWGEYFRTGDLGKLDGEGNLTFVGRKKEIIITGGINVYPADIESVLVGFSGIKEVAAFAIPNSQLGEIVGLAVVEEPGQTVDLRRMRHHCAVTLADFQQPREFIVVDNLPRNSMGKLMRRTLAENYLKGNSGERG